MKKKLLISVKLDAMQDVAEALREKGISDLEILETIGVITIKPKNLTIAEIKKIEGVENVEEERDVSI